MIQKLVNRGRSFIGYILNWLTSPAVTQSIGEFFFSLVGMRRNVQEIDLAHLKRVLVVRLDEIGDVVMTTPFLRELRRNLPDAWITLVVKPAVYNLVELCPYINEVLIYRWNTDGHLPRLRQFGQALRLAWKRMWRWRFDLAILPRWDTDHYQASFVAYFSGAPWRVGYSENTTDRKRRRNRGFDRLFTHVLEKNTLKHEVEHNLDVIRFLGGTVKEDRLELWVGDEDMAFAENVFMKGSVQPGELVIAFGPSSGNSPMKQWPVKNFIKLGCWLREKYGARVLVIGGPGEETLGKEIEQALGSSLINVIGKTTLRQMAALMKLCDLYVGNDTGPMHVAAAMGISVVAFFGSSCHHRFGPRGKCINILWLGLPCSPCFQAYHLDRCSDCIFDRPHCILGVTIEQAKEAVVALLSPTKYHLKMKDV